MSTITIEDFQRKEVEGDNHVLQINTSNTEVIEDSNKNITNEKEIEKSSNSDVVVNIDDSLQDNLKKGLNDKDFMVYGYHGQKHVLPTTWVYFQTGQHIPDDGSAPLDYTPDRNAFIKLVFIIVFLMLSCTAGLTTVAHVIDELGDMFKGLSGLIMFVAAAVLMIGLNYAMACSACSRVMPCNVICLVLAVLGMSVICIYVTVRYDTEIILLAMAATAGVVFICILLACTRFDFTKWLLFVIVIGGAIAAVGLIVSLYMLITGHYIKILHIVILIAGTVFSVIALIIELQMILGGKAVELSEDDYALGAFLLYTSIIDIFLKLVQIFGIIDNW